MGVGAGVVVASPGVVGSVNAGVDSGVGVTGNMAPPGVTGAGTGVVVVRPGVVESGNMGTGVGAGIVLGRDIEVFSHIFPKNPIAILKWLIFTIGISSEYVLS